MKHLRTYENIRHFEVDDVIILNAKEVWEVYPYVKIIDVSKDHGYYIEAYMRRNMMKMNFWLDNFDIERLATPEEIEEFELLKDTKKYNV